MSLKLTSKLKVRDYECDLQGIVNNANYFHYLEQSRHEFLNENNIDFQKAHDEGFDLVVSAMDVKFIKALKPRDLVEITVNFSVEGKLRYVFNQEIHRVGNGLTGINDEKELILQAKVTCACIDLKRQRPTRYPWLDSVWSSG